MFKDHLTLQAGALGDVNTTPNFSVPTLPYMRELDGLRAVAVLAVMYTHYLPEPYWLGGVYWGNLGVKLFFVLSGFLITQILLRNRHDVETAGHSALAIMRQFYMRRFLRIFPLYYAVLIIALSLNISGIRESILWHALYLSNVYFGIQNAFQGALGHLWSLSVEEQFYLVWPWLVLFMPRRYLGLSIIGLVLSAPAFRLWAHAIEMNDVAIWVLTPSVLDYLGLGSFLAYATFYQETFRLPLRALQTAFFVVGSLAIIIHNTIHPETIWWQEIYATLLGFMMVWIVARTSQGAVGWAGFVLSCSPMVYLGKISYGLYVIHLFPRHIPASFLPDALGLGTGLSQALTVSLWSAITLGLAMISWHGFEKPINDLKRFFPYYESAPPPRTR